eukprot:5688585-Heterocapsa_arctica.AAC.1
MPDSWIPDSEMLANIRFQGHPQEPRNQVWLDIYGLRSKDLGGPSRNPGVSSSDKFMSSGFVTWFTELVTWFVTWFVT